MAIQSIDATIFASSHPDINRRISNSGLLISGVMLVCSILSFVSTFEIQEGTSLGSIVLMFVGTVLFLSAIFRLYWKSRVSVYAPTGSATKEYSFFFDLKYLEKLTGFVQSGLFPGELDIKSDITGNIRMDVILSADHKFAAVQLLQFVPYTYQPMTTVKYLTNNEATSLAVFLAQVV